MDLENFDDENIKRLEKLLGKSKRKSSSIEEPDSHCSEASDNESTVKVRSIDALRKLKSKKATRDVDISDVKRAYTKDVSKSSTGNSKPSIQQDISNPQLGKKIKSLVNKLSSINFQNSIEDLRNIFNDSSKTEASNYLADAILYQLDVPQSISSGLIISYSGIVRAMQLVYGNSAAIPILNRTVNSIETALGEVLLEEDNDDNNQDNEPKKAAVNFAILLANLYRLNVVHHRVIFEFLDELQTINTNKAIELIYVLIEIAGVQLHSNDSNRLRQLVNNVLLKSTDSEPGISGRSYFLINSLKKLKSARYKSHDESTTSTFHSIQKQIQNFKQKHTRASGDTLNISYEDLKMVNSLNTRNDQYSITKKISHPTDLPATIDDSLTQSDKFSALYKKLGLNTQVRRAIFHIIAISHDYMDAFCRLDGLRLKKIQRLEIPRIVCLCTQREKHFNIYYALLANKLCIVDRNYRKAFEFYFWEYNDKLNTRDLTLKSHEFSNMAQLVAYLLQQNTLTFKIFKNVSIFDATKRSKAFYEILFIKYLWFILQRLKYNVTLAEQEIKSNLATIHENLELCEVLTKFIKHNLQASEFSDALVEEKHVSTILSLIGYFVKVLE